MGATGGGPFAPYLSTGDEILTSYFCGRPELSGMGLAEPFTWAGKR